VSGRAPSLLEEVAAHARPDDESFADAIGRFMEAEDKRKRRSCRPVDHLLLRLDLRAFPFPIVARALPPLDAVPIVNIRALIGEQELCVDVAITEPEITRSSADILEHRVKAALYDLWREAFDLVLRFRSAEEADDLLLEREQERGFEFDGKVRTDHLLHRWPERHRP
jgi:hypothetical protein